MTDADFRREIDRWILRPPPDEDPEYLRERDAAEAMEAYYRPVVITDFAECRYKPGDKVKWTDPDGRHAEGTVVGATSTPAQGWPEYVILEGRNIVSVDELILAHGWITTDPPEYTGPNGEKVPPGDIPF
jgi:hypothetical protein